MGNISGQYRSLSKEEKFLITNSWCRIRSDLTKSGANLFVIVFTDFPKMGTYFPFRGPLEDAFERHINVFMRELDTLIRSIDDPEELGDLLTNNARSHVPRNITKEDYQKLKCGVLKMIKAQLGTDLFKRDMEKAWDKSLTLAFNFIMEISANLKLERCSN